MQVFTQHPRGFVGPKKHNKIPSVRGFEISDLGDGVVKFRALFEASDAYVVSVFLSALGKHHIFLFHHHPGVVTRKALDLILVCLC